MKRRVAELGETEREALRRLFAPLSEMVFVLDTDQRFTALFGRGTEALGADPGHALGKTMREVFGGAACGHDEGIRRALAGDAVVYQWEAAGGRACTMQTSLTPLLDDEGTVAGVVGIGHEVTELVRRQRELEAVLAERDAQLARKLEPALAGYALAPGAIPGDFGQDEVEPEGAGGVRTEAAGLRGGLERIAEVLRELGIVTSEARSLPHRLETEIPKLSPREQQVLNLLLANLRVGSIAVRLKISPNTVRNHLKAVFRKLGVHSQRELLELLHQA